MIENIVSVGSLALLIAVFTLACVLIASRLRHNRKDS